MAYHTVGYLFLFLPLVLLIYQLVPQKFRWLVLLVSGYFFFWTFSGKLVLVLAGTTLFTHQISILLYGRIRKCAEEAAAVTGEKAQEVKRKYRREERLILTAGFLVLFGILAYLKYYNFFAENINTVMQFAGRPPVLQIRSLVLPIGISFYTLQAAGYLADVYWEKIIPDRYPGKLALFLAFFPQIMEGPISMYSQTADALRAGKSLKAQNLTDGCVRIIWGLFKKLIIADRLHFMVKSVFDQYSQYSGALIAAAAVAYTIQLYMEFSGCMDIVTGTGKMFGITLPENFRQPFASKNAAEFWRRWHITLGVWLKTYVFYPVSVSGFVKKWNRFARKKLGKHAAKVGVSAIALFPVWLFNGLWHGARWNYIFYGLYYFVILMLGIILEPVRTRILETFHINENAVYWKLPAVLKTWLIIFTGELFFRADGLRAGMQMFLRIFSHFDLKQLTDGTLLNLGLDRGDYFVASAGCFIVGIVGILKERNLLKDYGIKEYRTPVRWALYYSLILAVIIFGAYGVGYQQVDLIYAGF